MLRVRKPGTLRVRKLDKFIARQFGLLFVGTFFICLFVLMMQFLWRYIDQLIGKGLSMDVLAQFFWYMSLMLVPQALPLALLLSSLITFGNMGESCELTAIKASGISLMQAFRPLIAIAVAVSVGSFYFQDIVAPSANMSFSRLLLAMKQKSPELEIPEGIFYDGIPDCNLYVQRKDMSTGKLYGLMIYKITGGYDDAAIILADSGMLQSTAEKKHLLLTLHSGEWFENMKSQDLSGAASIPYRRETFVDKQILLDFDADFSMTDANVLSNNARGKSLAEIRMDIDSLEHVFDSIGRAFYKDARMAYYADVPLAAGDSVRLAAALGTDSLAYDSIYGRLPAGERLRAVNVAMGQVGRAVQDLSFKSLLTSDGDRLIRQHRIEALGKFTLALSCMIFFFIGAPLGAIIRKGGLGVPVIISVLVFIVYYIFDNTGYRMARGGMWSIAFGKGIATAVLAPLAVFFTYKANKDSTVFNVDAYVEVVMKALGLRRKRSVAMKDVVISDPSYAEDAAALGAMNAEIAGYMACHALRRAPNPVGVFLRNDPDEAIEGISSRLESILEDLSNTRDKAMITYVNAYPVLDPRGHTRPFCRRWLNAASAVVVPVGLFLYFRTWRLGIRLHGDLAAIAKLNARVVARVPEMEREARARERRRLRAS